MKRKHEGDGPTAEKTGNGVPTVTPAKKTKLEDGTAGQPTTTES